MELREKNLNRQSEAGKKRRQNSKLNEKFLNAIYPYSWSLNRKLRNFNHNVHHYRNSYRRVFNSLKENGIFPKHYLQVHDRYLWRFFHLLKKLIQFATRALENACINNIPLYWNNVCNKWLVAKVSIISRERLWRKECLANQSFHEREHNINWKVILTHFMPLVSFPF